MGKRMISRAGGSLRVLVPLALCMILACQAGVKRGDDRYGPKTIVISQSNMDYLADPEKDTVVIVDSIPFVSGDTVELFVSEADILLFEDTRMHRFRDVTGDPVISSFAYDLDAETVAPMPLREDPMSPSLGVLLSDSGTYVLRYHLSSQGSRWEIDRR